MRSAKFKHKQIYPIRWPEMTECAGNPLDEGAYPGDKADFFIVTFGVRAKDKFREMPGQGVCSSAHCRNKNARNANAGIGLLCFYCHPR